MYLQKVISRKNCVKNYGSFLLASWRSMTKIAGSGSRIRIRIHMSEAWIRGSGSTPKCHGSGTLLDTVYNVCCVWTLCFSLTSLSKAPRLYGIPQVLSDISRRPKVIFHYFKKTVIQSKKLYKFGTYKIDIMFTNAYWWHRGRSSCTHTAQLLVPGQGNLKEIFYYYFY